MNIPPSTMVSHTPIHPFHSMLQGLSHCEVYTESKAV
jgi:hypothetical protein